MPSQTDIAQRFCKLHEGPGAFIIPNPWDAGSARILASLGFQALATSSAGFAFSIGRKDGAITREEAIAHVRAIAEATGLPVSADLENCFAHEPDKAAETIRLAAKAGAVGGSIEDYSGDPAKAIYDFEHAVERVAAAVETARGLGFPFALTARTENYLHGRPDLDDTIKRLQAFEAAGADVLYAPGLKTLDEVRTVCAAVGQPVNVLATADFTLGDLSAAGARRVSVGGALFRAAMAGLFAAAREMRGAGGFTWHRTAAPGADISKAMRGRG